MPGAGLGFRVEGMKICSSCAEKQSFPVLKKVQGSDSSPEALLQYSTLYKLVEAS